MLVTPAVIKLVLKKWWRKSQKIEFQFQFLLQFNEVLSQIHIFPNNFWNEISCQILNFLDINLVTHLSTGYTVSLHRRQACSPLPRYISPYFHSTNMLNSHFLSHFSLQICDLHHNSHKNQSHHKLGMILSYTKIDPLKKKQQTLSSFTIQSSSTILLTRCHCCSIVCCQSIKIMGQIRFQIKLRDGNHIIIHIIFIWFSSYSY